MRRPVNAEVMQIKQVEQLQDMFADISMILDKVRKMDDKQKKLDEKIDDKMKKLEEKLDEKMEKMDEKVESIRAMLAKK